MLLGILILATVIWALIVGIVIYDGDPGAFVLGFLLGLLQGGFLSLLIFVGVHFAVKYW